MIAYLAPTLFVVILLIAAVRLRRQIEPACPACGARSWQTAPAAPTVLACTGCDWSMGSPAANREKLAA